MPFKDPEKAKEYKRKWIADHRSRTQKVEPSRTQKVEPSRTQKVEPSRTQKVEPHFCPDCAILKIKKINENLLSKFQKWHEKQKKQWRDYKKQAKIKKQKVEISE